MTDARLLANPTAAAGDVKLSITESGTGTGTGTSTGTDGKAVCEIDTELEKTFGKPNALPPVGRSYHLKCLFLSVAIIAAIVVVLSVSKERLLLLIPAFLYILYLIEAAKSTTYRDLSSLDVELSDLRSTGTMDSIIARLRRSVPALCLDSECYHYETRTRTTTDSDGNTKTETEEEKVVTFSESLRWGKIERFIDQSRFTQVSDQYRHAGGVPLTPIDSSAYGAVEGSVATRLSLSKKWSFTDDEAGRADKIKYDRYVAEVKKINAERDTHLWFEESMAIDKWYDGVLVLSGGAANRPALLHAYVFQLLTLVLGAWPYRVWLDGVTDRRHYEVVKRVTGGRLVMTADGKDRFPYAESTEVRGPGYSIKRVTSNGVVSYQVPNAINPSAPPLQVNTPGPDIVHVNAAVSISPAASAPPQLHPCEKCGTLVIAGRAFCDACGQFTTTTK